MERTVDDILGEKEITKELLHSVDISDLMILARELFGLEESEIIDKNQYTGQLAAHLEYLLNQEIAEMGTPLTDEEIIRRKNEQIVKDFVRNPQHQKDAVEIACQIRDVFDRNWFTVKDLLSALEKARKRKITRLKAKKKFEEIEKMEPLETYDELKNRLGVLQLFGLVKFKVDPKGKRPVKHRINMTLIQRAIEAEQQEKKRLEEEKETKVKQKVDEVTK